MEGVLMSKFKIQGKYRASQDIAISGWDCGSEFEFKMVVEFRIIGGTPATMIDPEEPASAEIDKIRFFEHKPGSAPKEIEFPDFIVEKFTEAEGFKAWLFSEANDQLDAAEQGL